MISKCFFSIIIPTFNASRTLKNCLESIKAQTFRDYEIIVADGESTDGTLEIVLSYQSSLPLKFRSEKDSGAYDAMNKGISSTAGQYLYFLGSDDTLFNENVLLNINRELVKTGAKVIYGNVKMHGNNKWVKDGLIHAGKFDLKRLLSSNICHQSIFYHSSVFEILGNFDIRYQVFADYDFNLRCFANYTFYYTDLIIANFNLGGLSTKLTDERFDCDKNEKIVRYFFSQIFSKTFITCRFYLKKAALSKTTDLNFWTRLYCMAAYSKLKIQSLF